MSGASKTNGYLIALHYCGHLSATGRKLQHPLHSLLVFLYIYILYGDASSGIIISGAGCIGAVVLSEYYYLIHQDAPFHRYIRKVSSILNLQHHGTLTMCGAVS